MRMDSERKYSHVPVLGQKGEMLLGSPRRSTSRPRLDAKHNSERTWQLDLGFQLKVMPYFTLGAMFSHGFSPVAPKLLIATWGRGFS